MNHKTPTNNQRPQIPTNNRSTTHFVNKKSYCKNILETYFNLGYVNLSSSDLNTEDKKREEKQTNKRTLQFKLVIEGLTEELFQEIRIIDDVKSIDIIRWCKDFDELINLNKWNKNIQLAVLKQLVKDERIVDEGLKESWKEIKEQLIRANYPLEEERLYKKKLQKIFQINYITIQEYYDELKKIITILQTMSKMKDTEAKVLLGDAFFNGLGKY
ncbi:hypothetical protein NGRA_3467, partial [Nosema granulosis]